MPKKKIVIVGGGYAGFYTAWNLEKQLRPEEADVVVVDPRPYMTYQPFLPEVTAGSVEARHAAVSLRRHLRRSRVLTGTVTRIDHARRSVTVRSPSGHDLTIGYDLIAVTAGAVTRTLPIPGLSEQAIGLKHVEEAVAIRDRLLAAFDQASLLPPGPDRRRLLTVTVVGGGFTGVEGFGELLSLGTALLKLYPGLTPSDLAFHLVEASDRILPEVSASTARWVVRSLQQRGGHIHLGTTVRSADHGHVVLSNGQSFDTELLIWTAGNAANPVVATHTDLPVTNRGQLVVRADLRVGSDTQPIPDAWGAGDAAAVPDLTSPIPGTFTPPTAQHAVRQGRRLARNITASLRGRRPRNYRHHNLGAVATLGLGRGVFQSGPIVIKGFPAWLIHRSYHLLAIPSWERKIRVLAVWLPALIFGRDIVSLQAVQHPRAAFLSAGAPLQRRPPSPAVAAHPPAPPAGDPAHLGAGDNQSTRRVEVLQGSGRSGAAYGPAGNGGTGPDRERHADGRP